MCKQTRTKDHTICDIGLGNNPTTMINNLTTTPNGMANIQGLSKGFGTYTEVRHSMGQATETSKGTVRGNIDQIRLKLLDMLSLYKKGSYDDSFSTARSAYLDNYENIELPLRPINRSISYISFRYMPSINLL